MSGCEYEILKLNCFSFLFYILNQKLNVTIILDGNIQSSRLIGLIQSDYGSYGLFIWNENNNDIIETIIPIDRQFHYQLGMLECCLRENSFIFSFFFSNT